MKKFLVFLVLLSTFIIIGCEKEDVKDIEMEDLNDAVETHEDDLDDQNINAMNSLVDEEKLESSYVFEIEEHPTSKLWDQRLVRIDEKNGDKEIVFNSIRDAIEQTGAVGGSDRLMRVFAEPEGFDVIIFRTIVPDTDNPSGQLLKFDKESFEMNLMEINDFYEPFFDGEAMSENEIKFVWVPDDEGKSQVMYLINLIDEDYEIVMELVDGETFNGGLGAMSSFFSIEFMGSDKLRYSVFDHDSKGNDFNPFDEDEREAILLRTETIDISLF
ncbi:hypothetical protein ACFL21_03615 [Patescibacteria group bacterium]